MYDWNALFGEVEPEVVQVAEPEPSEVASDAESIEVDVKSAGAREQLEEIDPDDLTPCPVCDSLELWQNPIGDWRCLRCDPPDTARRIKETAKRLRESPSPCDRTREATTRGPERPDPTTESFNMKGPVNAF